MEHNPTFIIMTNPDQFYRTNRAKQHMKGTYRDDKAARSTLAVSLKRWDVEVGTDKKAQQRNKGMAEKKTYKVFSLNPLYQFGGDNWNIMFKQILRNEQACNLPQKIPEQPYDEHCFEQPTHTQSTFLTSNIAQPETVQKMGKKKQLRWGGGLRLRSCLHSAAFGVDMLEKWMFLNLLRTEWFTFNQPALKCFGNTTRRLINRLLSSSCPCGVV